MDDDILLWQTVLLVVRVSLVGISGIPRNFVWGGSSTNSVEDGGPRERGSGSSSPLVRGSGGSCNLVQEISFHIVNFLNFWYFKTIYDDSQFICRC